MREDNLKKLDFLLGKARGRAHNIKRSQAMLRQLEKIGFFDNSYNREYIANYLDRVYLDSTNIAETQADGERVVKESLLMGKYGGRFMEISS